MTPGYRSAIETVTAPVVGGVSQRELGRHLAKHPSFVNKIELLERRLDILEFIAVAKALQIDPAGLLQSIVASLPDQVEL